MVNEELWRLCQIADGISLRAFRKQLEKFFHKLISWLLIQGAFTEENLLHCP